MHIHNLSSYVSMFACYIVLSEEPKLRSQKVECLHSHFTRIDCNNSDNDRPILAFCPELETGALCYMKKSAMSNDWH